MIPLPSQFDIHGRETPVTDRQDINVVTPSKSVNSPSMSRLPVRIPAALKEGRGMTRSPSADLRNELRSSDPDLGSLSKNEFRGSGGSLKSSSRPDLRQVHNEIRSLSKGRGSDDNLKLTPRDNIVKDISAPKPNDALVLDAKEIAAEMENLARERQAIFLRKEDESKKRQALEEEQRKSDKEAILAETKRMEQAAAKKLMEAKKIDEENTKKQQEILRQQKIQAEEDQKKKELDQIDNLVDPQLQRYIDLVKKNRTEEAKSDAQHLEAAAYDYGAGETDQELR